MAVQIKFLCVRVSDSELQVQSAEQRALKGEEALQAALDKIQDLEGQLQGRSNQGSRSGKGTKIN